MFLHSNGARGARITAEETVHACNEKNSETRKYARKDGERNKPHRSAKRTSVHRTSTAAISIRLLHDYVLFDYCMTTV